eukprot:GHRQ01033950.1.p1 GENE.GHRQ01033950.1~~GHRQ01033950.1.p1  ORF type:complete len:137 (-),score=7.81 GHRQ01033950.1:735-1145(-)
MQPVLQGVACQQASLTVRALLAVLAKVAHDSPVRMRRPPLPCLAWVCIWTEPPVVCVSSFAHLDLVREHHETVRHAPTPLLRNRLPATLPALRLLLTWLQELLLLLASGRPILQAVQLLMLLRLCDSFALQQHTGS